MPAHTTYGMRKLVFNSIVLSLGSYLATAASAVTFLFAARGLGPREFGSISSAIGIAIVVAAFADFGINGWTIRELARNPDSRDPLRRTLTAKLTLAALLALAWVLVAIVTLGNTAFLVPVMLLGGYLGTLVVSGTLTVPFRAAENMSLVSVVAVVEKVVALGASVGMQALLGYRPEVLPGALLAGGSASVLCAAILIPRNLVAFQMPSFRQVVELWRTSFSFGLVGVAAQLLRADAAIVSAVAGPFAAGVYAAPARLTSFLTVIPASFSAAVFPRIARSAMRGTSRRPELLTAIAMFLAVGGLIGACEIISPVLVPFALGAAYSSSASVFRVFLLVVLVNALNQPLLALMQADGREHYAGWVVVWTAGVGLIAIAIGAYLGGAMGAAIGALILQLLQVTLFAVKSPWQPRVTTTGRELQPMGDSLAAFDKLL